MRPGFTGAGRPVPLRAASRALLALLVCACAQAPGFAGELLFDNLGEPARVVEEDGRQLLLHRGRQLPVRVADRLLAATSPSISADDLRRMDRDILQAQQLAAQGGSHIWLLTVTEGRLATVLAALQAQPGLRGVQPDLLQVRELAGVGAVSAAAPAFPPADSANAPAGARVAIIDDGFDLAHPALAGARVLLEYDADLRTADASPKLAADGHGTRVAGVVLATATADRDAATQPGLVAIRQASTWSSDLVLAFSVARMMRADVVNASWVLAYLPQPLAELVQDWRRGDHPPYLVVAAGNDARDACEANALSAIEGVWLVGALDAQGQPAAYSNHGQCLSLAAPALHASARRGGGHAPFGGTSAAAAHVSGLLLRALGQGERPDLDAMRRQLAELEAPR